MPSPEPDIDRSSRLKAVWKRFGVADRIFLVALLAYLVSGFAGVGSAARFLLLLLVIGVGVVAGIRWLRLGVRKAIWNLRNRLLVAYLFIAVVPVFLIGILAFGTSLALASQISVYVVSSELDRRLDSLAVSAESLAQAPPNQRERAWERVRTILGSEFPNLDVVITQDGVVRFPEEPTAEPPPEGWGEISGVVVREGVLYSWARGIQGQTEVTLTSPLTKQFLLSLAPGIGEVTILEFADTPAGEEQGRRMMRPHDPMPGEDETAGNVMPPPKNRLDYDFKQGTSLPVAIWDSPPTVVGGLLSIHSRFSAVLDVIFVQQAENRPVLLILSGLTVIFLIVELISLIIGVSLTRTITSAFGDLFEGTQSVQRGDFSHRIAVKGDDQLAVVSESFNRMAENLERLLAVSKEKERMQAELEIAQAVQRQLYPKSVPALSKLELLAICNPARMVSGDYYDYQALSPTSAVVALGDVAGKGISAALLMATLQSSLRTQVRSCLDGTSENGKVEMSTSTLVSQLNEQVYSDTSPEKYATFYFSVYDDDSGLLTYTNAGHLPPMLFRKGKVSELDVNGMVVGAFPFAQYGESQLQLESGDLLLVFTDGITEPENEYGEMFGEERVKDLVLRHAHLEMDQIVKALMEAVMEWTGSPELQDDMTVLMARRH